MVVPNPNPFIQGFTALPVEFQNAASSKQGATPLFCEPRVRRKKQRKRQVWMASLFDVD